MYSGVGATMYDDVTRADVSELREVEAALGATADLPENILDVAAGSGRVTEALLRLPWSPTVTALDTSEELLSVLDSRLARYGTRVQILRADARFTATRSQFDAAVIATSSISLFGTADREAVFNSVNSMLSVGSTLVVTNFMSRSLEGSSVRGATGDSGMAYLVREEILSDGTRRTQLRNPATGETSAPSRVQNIPSDQLSNEIKLAGFRIDSSDFLRNDAIGEHVLFVATKLGSSGGQE